MEVQTERKAQLFTYIVRLRMKNSEAAAECKIVSVADGDY